MAREQRNNQASGSRPVVNCLEAGLYRLQTDQFWADITAQYDGLRWRVTVHSTDSDNQSEVLAAALMVLG